MELYTFCNLSNMTEKRHIKQLMVFGKQPLKMITKLAIFKQKFHCAKRAFVQFGILFALVLALVGCFSPVAPTEMPAGPSSPLTDEVVVETTTIPETPAETIYTPTSPPTATPTLVPVTPSQTPAPLFKITPYLTPEGLRMRFDSWSSDGFWLTYWLAEDDEHPASLHFKNVKSGESCQAEDVQAVSTGSDLLLWQEDGSVVILPSGLIQGAMQGVPCGVFVSAGGGILPESSTNTYLSPDGRYQAETVIVQQEEVGFHTDLQITETATGQNLLSMRYLGTRHFSFGGPSWLTNDLYVIGRTVEQDILYYSVAEDRVGQLYPDLLGLEAESTYSLFSQTDPASGTFHLLLLSDGPPLLYHSESGELEELPYSSVSSFTSTGSYPFSPDGKWLLLSQRPGGAKMLRSVDPPGSVPIQIAAAQSRVGGLAPNGQKMVFLRGPGSINIVRFPDGEFLSQWRASGYDIQAIWWSPDSKWLVAWGINTESGLEVLFVIEP
jgi:hypothetical protein